MIVLNVGIKRVQMYHGKITDLVWIEGFHGFRVHEHSRIVIKIGMDS